NREKAQLADGYFARVRRYWSDSRTLTDLPSQERQFLLRAQQDCGAAQTLYQEIGVYGNAVGSLRRLIEQCRVVDERLNTIHSVASTLPFGSSQ
ncbi:MAG: hypothetical protein IRZ15_15295, partial [Bryobacteraceae bacterium]|nr:hypothetical protein [Bryobacteraceae bacterium]